MRALLALMAWPAWAMDVVTLTDGLDHPWSIELTENYAYVVERDAGMVRLDLNDGTTTEIQNLPDAYATGQGGRFDLLLAPDYADTGRVFMALNAGDWSGSGLALWTGRIQDDALIEARELYQMRPTRGGRHFGGRLVTDGNYVYLSTGDRGEAERAQDPDDSAGSILRFTLSGEAAGVIPGHPALYSMGHRNVQGLWMDPDGQLWAHEHGPQGGDELNRIAGGENHGWPLVTYGRNYGLGTRISDFETLEGYTDPTHQWTPSIAPAGLIRYQGDRFPDWQGDFLIGALKYQLVSQVSADGTQEIARHFTERFGRIRDLAEDSQGRLYLLTDDGRGKVIRVQ
ncbi:MAG: PQQ-dependent sugar dehydrogenase [Pseudomonadales bacterium]